MSAQDDEHSFENLSDLLGPDENLTSARPDLFETVAPTSSYVPTKKAGLGFDSRATQPSGSLVLLDTEHEGPCLRQIREYALDAHAGQQRRYTTEPYWKHLSEVAGLVATSSYGSPRALALAWLHDIVEDTSVTLRDIERLFGAPIADGVRCLTGSANPTIGREERKRRDRQRLAAGDAEVHTVKLADIASNLASIGRFDPEFALGGYLEEKRLEVGVLTQGDASLKKLVRTLWADARRMAEES
ncbi:HD domain-containing protein [Marinobacterium marinum]|uniref:Bifunctional (P)ppGpp synthetase/guanosine-3',5'-bis(Diphosphate) 3'-pyrophosphohydrolase n=1 Tax=Marinobacterium marinum TaxID=2756129 RepID=A0A7W1WVQ3_9GAMM|nr:HD domain-containing protein [Marinobacterium marinum]MBA4501100.1 bifunctional (p)ppGpp synthetase/guanosine-3',5'-bis(diphosphate) 3'-pyrophosphohydrolase [Marinobacterium marinum]